MKIPNQIWLQMDDIETTWCEDKINDDDPYYVRFVCCMECREWQPAEASRYIGENERELWLCSECDETTEVEAIDEQT